ncbi:AAA domain-containing protein [Phanerochaete sordida]|uniref:AAA domain-containing protein n=1 Tax=Phanerochaete sordida TaxID=48140 RepID=A0A9P3LGU9_9APHY|nr:AAA domain-containing protein [Phanerochaete sordida]
MQTRSTVLGKRSAPSDTSSASSLASSPCDIALPPTPEQTPTAKRIKHSSTEHEGDGNKENVPPFRVEAISGSPATTPRVARSLRRSSSEQLTPSRKRTTPRKHASVSTVQPITPATAISQLALVTPPPSPHHSLQPISTRVRALLRPTCNHVGHMAGRRSERDVITRFVSAFVSASQDGPPAADDASILYVSGTPGTGKTALVNSVLGDMRDELADAGVSVISVNCMAVNDVEALYARLVEDLSKGGKRSGRGRKPKETSLQAVDRLLNEQNAKCLVLLDEIDHIASSSQALTSVFTLARTHATSLRLIGIANTHTLSSSSSATSASMEALAGVQTMHFSPYTPEELLQIVSERLAPLQDTAKSTSSESLDNFLPRPTLMLLTKKVAAMTGDVRAVFEVLRGAINIAVNTSAPNVFNPLDVSTPPVTPTHVLSALKAYSPASSTSKAMNAIPKKASDSETVVKVRELGLQARLVLLAMVLARRRVDANLALGGSTASSPSLFPRTPTKRSSSLADVSSGAALDAGQLFGYYKTILSRSDEGLLTAVSRSEFGDLLGLLETVGLLQLSGAASIPSTPTKSGKRSLARSISFGGAKGSSAISAQEVKFIPGIRTDEVTRGLGIVDGQNDALAPAADDPMEEEIRVVFEKERVQIVRETNAKAKTSSDGHQDTL